jgi:hypothetical protein
MSQINPVHPTLSYFSNFNIILPHKSRSP